MQKKWTKETVFEESKKYSFLIPQHYSLTLFISA